MRSILQTSLSIGTGLILSLQAPLLLATDQVREEPIPIRTIVANPQAFTMRVVRLQGIIKSLQVIPDGGGCRTHGVYDAYIFILNDHTGELPIVDRGDCQGSTRFYSVKAQIAEFAAGDTVEVVIHVSLIYSPDFESRSLEGVLRWVKRLPHLTEDESGPNP
jgi:hypothetical protein